MSLERNPNGYTHSFHDQQGLERDRENRERPIRNSIERQDIAVGDTVSIIRLVNGAIVPTPFVGTITAERRVFTDGALRVARYYFGNIEIRLRNIKSIKKV